MINNEKNITKRTILNNTNNYENNSENENYIMHDNSLKKKNLIYLYFKWIFAAQLMQNQKKKNVYKITN